VVCPASSKFSEELPKIYYKKYFFLFMKLFLNKVTQGKNSARMGENQLGINTYSQLLTVIHSFEKKNPVCGGCWQI
jgi:hypothetical protein